MILPFDLEKMDTITKGEMVERFNLLVAEHNNLLQLLAGIPLLQMANQTHPAPAKPQGPWAPEAEAGPKTRAETPVDPGIKPAAGPASSPKPSRRERRRAARQNTATDG